MNWKSGHSVSWRTLRPIITQWILDPRLAHITGSPDQIQIRHDGPIMGKYGVLNQHIR